VILTVGVRAVVFVPVPIAALKILTPPAVSVWGHVMALVAFTQEPPLHAPAATVVTISAGSAFAPFVGAVAASLALAEAVRYLGGAPMYEVLSVSLRSPDYIDVAPNTRPGPPTNPGFTRALP